MIKLSIFLKYMFTSYFSELTKKLPIHSYVVLCTSLKIELLSFKKGLDDLFQHFYTLFRGLKSAKSRCGLN